jgi:hypothetical protein
MLRTVAATAIVAAVTATAPLASAQACGDREEVVSRLGNLHAERLVAAGLQDERHIVEIWASEDGSTWTLLLSRVDGLTCIMGAGSAWSSYPENQLSGIEG